MRNDIEVVQQAMQVQPNINNSISYQQAMLLKRYGLTGLDVIRTYTKEISNPIFFPSMSQKKRRLINRRINNYKKR